MSDPNLTRQVTKNLLYLVRTAAGSELFKHIYVVDKRTGQEFDALDNGENSCAYVVSGILALVGLIDHPHATVATTLQRMREAGWQETTNPKPGDVIHWAAKDDLPDHLGFLLDDGMCMCNSSTQQVPVIMENTSLNGREPDVYYTHEVLHPLKT